MAKPKYILDYGLIKNQIERLLSSVVNKIEREWSNSRPPYAAFTVVIGTVTTVNNTFKTIRFLSSDTSHDWRHRPEMALAVPPLARTILDSLYTCIFLFEDLPGRSDWYMSSGWRELFEYVERAKRDYGSNADWKEHIAQAEPALDRIAALLGKPSTELQSSRWWPTPQQMKRFTTDASIKTFFEYLDDWYYREFSQISHGTLPGLIQSAGALRDLVHGDTGKVEQMRGYYSIQVVILLISLYSELEAELKLGVRSDLNYVWTILKEHYPFAGEIYDRRGYATRLS